MSHRYGPRPIGLDRRSPTPRAHNWLILKVRVSSSNRARDAIDLVAATVDAAVWILEHAIFGEDLIYENVKRKREFREW